MAISRKRKEELVEQYVELLNQSRAIFLAEYAGVSVAQLEELRAEVRNVDGAFHITKNSLLRLALERTGRPIPEELFLGQTAAGFALGELPAMAKALVEFSEDVEPFSLKGGLMNGTLLSAEAIESLAKLPSLDELRAQIIGLVNAPAQNVTSAVANGVRQLINVLNAYATQEEAGEAA
ncbi:MAG TPA: 50S ribosomal protein L10 [Candidatus Binatia bacterium]|nr:50S ribosomal protein L10 [Candidatus Binatia bacterium]